MASINFVKNELERLGLTVAVDGAYILTEDPDLDFSRSHDGVRGVSRWLAETKSEYEAVCAALFEDSVDEEYPHKEEQMNIVEQQIKEELERPAPPEKDHRVDQLALAQELNSPKEIAQALENDGQDQGGIPNPEGYIRDMKLDAPAITVLVKGQRFMAPEGWRIQEERMDRMLYYGSIHIDRKWKNERLGSKFSLVRDL